MDVILVAHLEDMRVELSKKVSYMHVKLHQSCLTLCDAMDYSPPGPSVHRVLQARILEWVAISSSRGSSLPKD